MRESALQLLRIERVGIESGDLSAAVMQIEIEQQRHDRPHDDHQSVEEKEQCEESQTLTPEELHHQP